MNVELTVISGFQSLNLTQFPLKLTSICLFPKPHPPIIELAVVRLTLENDHLDWHKRFTSRNVAIQAVLARPLPKDTVPFGLLMCPLWSGLKQIVPFASPLPALCP